MLKEDGLDLAVDMPEAELSRACACRPCARRAPATSRHSL